MYKYNVPRVSQFHRKKDYARRLTKFTYLCGLIFFTKCYLEDMKYIVCTNKLNKQNDKELVSYAFLIGLFRHWLSNEEKLKWSVGFNLLIIKQNIAQNNIILQVFISSFTYMILFIFFFRPRTTCLCDYWFTCQVRAHLLIWQSLLYS